jgi:hypothetical protein
MSPMGMSVREFILNVAANIAASALSPVDMLGYLIALGFVVFWVAGWHRKRMAKGKRGVDSWYFIALTFIVAALAIGGAAYGLGLRSVVSGEIPNKAITSVAQPVTAQPQSQFIKNISLQSDLRSPLQLSARYAVTDQRLQLFVDIFHSPDNPKSNFQRFKIKDFVDVVDNVQFIVGLLSADPILPPSNEFYWGDVSLKNSIMDAQTFARLVILGPSGTPPQYFYFKAVRSQGAPFYIVDENAMDWAKVWRDSDAAR